MTKDLSEFAAADIFDIRDVIARFEELEQVVDDIDEQTKVALLAESSEYLTLKAFLEEVADRGGDEEWRGDWYPITFIADNYFDGDFAQSEAEDCGMVDSKLTSHWPYSCLDWDKAAEQLKQDYSSVMLDGNDFWYRSN